MDDPDRARVMAHASDDDETHGVHNRAAAYDALLETKADATIDGKRSAETAAKAWDDAKVATGLAEERREDADKRAQEASDLYDRIDGSKG